MSLTKWDRINRLMGFYGKLLTDRQQTMMRLYYEEDYSLGEIADYYQISRQAVHDNLNRASAQLEEYETQLQLIERNHTRYQQLTQLQQLLAQQKWAQAEQLIQQLIAMEQ